MLHAVTPIYQLNDLPRTKLDKLNTFVYSFFETEYGHREKKQKVSKRQRKDQEVKKLRQLKRELKKDWRRNKDNDCIDVLRKKFFKVTKMLNIIRKRNVEVEDAHDFQKQTNSFRKNPHNYAKKLFSNKKDPAPEFDAQTAHNFFQETYSDDVRGMRYKHPPNVMRPTKPIYPFRTDPPTREEIRASLKAKRNGAAPGPNGIPYLVYKKVPFLFHHLSLILQEMWPSFDLPQSRFGVTSLIYKNGSDMEVSNYRPVTMTNTDGKILLSILASRSLSYMKSNGYYNLGIQKGFINDMAGCAEHTTMLSELLKNAKQSNRQITVCWTDLENAFGSLRHDLIQYALDWYNFPMVFKEFVHAYYEGIYVKIRTTKWTTEPVALLKGIFQGCPLSVQLFNIVWNIALDMVQFSPARGYVLKEASIEKKQLSYVDDHTIITSSPENAQCMLDILDNYFAWSECMKAKPPKCRAISFKVFKNGVCDRFTPMAETKYSAYDPKLKVSGKNIPFLGEEPFKFLGRKISFKKGRLNREEIKESLIENLEIVSKANLTGPMKLWLYNHFIIAFITWPFMIYDLPLSFGGELKALATSYLKRWLGVTKTISESVLYRSKDHFGLGLTNLITHLKKMQVCRMHMLKYSQDDTSRKLYKHMSERDKPPVNKLGIPSKSKVWKPTNALEKAERDFYLDSFALDRKQQAVVNKSAVKMSRHNVLKRVEKDDEETRLTRCYSYAIQGDWLNFDAVVKADLSWNSLIYSIPQELLKFHLNSTHNVLPTSDNIRRWGKTNVDLKCCLCGYSKPTLKHVLNGCPMALKQGRYTWRHDSILLRLVEELQSCLGHANSCAINNIKIEDTFIKFVREGKQPSKSKLPFRKGLLFKANDWVLAYDSPQLPLVFPHHIVQTSLRPDIIIFSDTTRQVFILELTVPSEDNIVQRHTDKENKYAKLLDDIKMNQWTGHVFGVEVGSRGYVAKSFGFALQKLGLKQDAIRKLRKAISLICMRCSYSIYLSRKNEVWRPWETQHILSKTRNSGHLTDRTFSVSDADDFGGFAVKEVQEISKENHKRINILRSGLNGLASFQGFDSLETSNFGKVNNTRIDILRGYRHSRTNVPLVYDQFFPKTHVLTKIDEKSRPSEKSVQSSQKTQKLVKFNSKIDIIPPVSEQFSVKPRGLINLGNSCYMNSVMQCLYCVAPLVDHFINGAYLENINPLKSCGEIIAKELGVAFSDMMSGGNSPASLKALKCKAGELDQRFSGREQQDSHEFLVSLLDWLHKDLVGGELGALQSCGHTPHHLIAESLALENSVITSLFQGEHRNIIACGNCPYKSISVEPFRFLSLSLPHSGGCTLGNLIQKYYKSCSIDYLCPSCRKEGKSIMQTFIQKLPPVLIFHLNRFEYNISARKKQNYVDFPLSQLSLSEHTLCSDKQQPSYNLCAVSNHYGNINAGHYTSYCRPTTREAWYQCNDKIVTKLRTPIKTSAAYLLFYNSFHANLGNIP